MAARPNVWIWRSSASWNLAHVSPAFVFQYSICAMFEEAVWVIEATRLYPLRVIILTVEVTVATCLEQPPWLREVLQKSTFR